MVSDGSIAKITMNTYVGEDKNTGESPDLRRTEPQAQAHRLQRIGMTCRRIQLAGAVDAIEHGEEEEKVLKRLGGQTLDRGT